MIDLPDGFTLQYAVRLPNGNLHRANGEPVIWLQREYAEQALEQMRNHAAQIGMPGWTGHVVHSICSPFIDPSSAVTGAGLVDEISAWLNQQAGGKS